MNFFGGYVYSSGFNKYLINAGFWDGWFVFIKAGFWDRSFFLNIAIIRHAGFQDFNVAANSQ